MTLRQSVQKAAQSPQFIASIEKQCIIFDYSNALEFRQFAQEDGLRMAKMVKAIGKVD